MANEQPRTYAAAHFALELDGKDEVGLFKSIEGGNIKTEVMTYQNGANFDRWRQLGKPKFEDIKLQVGMSMSKPFYEWIENFVEAVVDRRTGSIMACDFKFQERARRDFRDALIKEIVFPRLDGKDTAAVYMNIGIAVEEMKFLKGSLRQVNRPSGFDAQKVWNANNFRLKLDGFEDPCSRVHRIDSFTIKQNIIEYHGGGMRAPLKVSSQVDYPNIVFYIPDADKDKFVEHFKKRGIDGQVPGRLTGMIQVFDSSPEKTVLFTLSFEGADLAAVTPDKLDAGTEEINCLRVEIYVEKMKFQYNSVT